MFFLEEGAKKLPVIHETELCVLGGSCTGVFAAVRAARLGVKTAIVEAHNGFGGVATNAMVNRWHTLYDTTGQRRIISGLTEEMLRRLKVRGAVDEKINVDGMTYYDFNSEELKIELDELVTESGIKAYLHTLFAAPFVQDGELIGVIVENKDGRGVIRAKAFVDATGDADLASRLGLETFYASHLQPGTTCAKIGNFSRIRANGHDFQSLFRQHREEFSLPDGFVWTGRIPGELDVHMLAGTRIPVNGADADALTAAEMEGRRQVRAIMDLIRKYCAPIRPDLYALPSRIGVRETRHVHCLHSLTGDEVLNGVRFADAIANGTYPSDLHHPDRAGITFRYLNGEQEFVRPGYEPECSRWREPREEDPTFYQIPYRSMIPRGGAFPNVIVAGRMIDADRIAHAAIRVMVNMNQTGEAAGTAAYLALSSSGGFADVDTDKLRSALAAGGSSIV